MKRVSLYGLGLFLLIVACSALIQSCSESAKEKNHAAVGFEFKEKLSEYGFFKGELKQLVPSDAAFRYDLVTPLFTDYTVKDRFIVLPKGKQIQYADSGILEYPDSTIILKNFAYRDSANQKIMIETRMLVKDPADKNWKVMDYVWNEQQTDADKVIIGASIPIRLRDDSDQLVSTVYKIPNTNDCKRCHNNKSVLLPLGPKVRNLNYTPEGETENQLVKWVAMGWLNKLPKASKLESLPKWNDSVHYSLEQRARAYLDVNCAHCHTRGGDAFNTGLFLNYDETDSHQLGIMKEPVSAGGGAGGLNYDIVPGDVSKSILAHRMNSAEPGTAMPELGRSIIHKEGVELIQQWIKNMKAR